MSADASVRNSGPPEVTDSRVLEMLRIGVGAIWAANLVFILDPSNAFFSSFQATAASFEPTTATGPALGAIAVAYPLPCALFVAFVTLYLALAFLAGATVRLACLVGVIFAMGLLLTQWDSTFVVPGGTDVGPIPLYLLLYGGLYVGGAGRSFTLRAWLLGRGRRTDSRRGLASPPT